ncbi:hypothetical protein [Chryseobacterium jejuense]|uniref:hypothetical protein n=1 Tax=Chryseobacterium jejuense TaxID=445960 RepID=UPI001D591BAA|nr:hypothetical protein [Chryseobacterium jejuense]MBP2617775.1 hypothetical protein [Chryseobacterium jejuense]
MPRKEASLKDKEGSVHVYTGVSIQDILAKAGAPSGKELHGENISKYLLAKCKDGYQVLFSLAELDASIADKNVIGSRYYGRKTFGRIKRSASYCCRRREKICMQLLSAGIFNDRTDQKINFKIKTLQKTV